MPLVTDHAEECSTRTACIAAVAKLLGASYELLRHRANEVEVGTGVRDGVPTDTASESRELKREHRDLEEIIEIRRWQQIFSRGRAVRDTSDLYVHRRGGRLYCGASHAGTRMAWGHPPQEGSHTVADPAAARAADLVKHHLLVPSPNVLLVADFTCGLSGGAFGYTAFAIDV